jgi:hypothetical protein
MSNFNFVAFQIIFTKISQKTKVKQPKLSKPARIFWVSLKLSFTQTQKTCLNSRFSDYIPLTFQVLSTPFKYEFLFIQMTWIFLNAAHISRVFTTFVSWIYSYFFNLVHISADSASKILRKDFSIHLSKLFDHASSASTPFVTSQTCNSHSAVVKRIEN